MSGGCPADSNLGLRSPKGLAVFQSQNASVLYVSDDEAQNIYAYDLQYSSSKRGVGTLSAGAQRRVCEGVQGGTPWLAVDGLGNLFFAAGESGQVQMISVADLFSGNPATPKVLYASDQATVSTPGGIATDNYFVYWTNQDAGESAGTVVRAYETVPANPATASTTYPKQLAANAAAAVSVCLARDVVFYTGITTSLFAVKRDGGSIAEVSNKFGQPRGCIYDTEGTLYVTDGDGSIYSLPANFVTLRVVRRLTKVMTVNDPWQPAIFSAGIQRAGASSIGPMRFLSLLLMLFAAWPVVCTLHAM